jgi:geranylgeranyl diphosphate synthase type 3
MYFVALQELFQLNDQRCIQAFTEEMIHLHQGQGMEIFYRDNLTCPTMEQYLDTVKNST